MKPLTPLAPVKVDGIFGEKTQSMLKYKQGVTEVSKEKYQQIVG